MARLLGQEFSETWGKPVVVDNISGAASNIAADRVAKATPDGYTLGLLGRTIANSMVDARCRRARDGPFV